MDDTSSSRWQVGFFPSHFFSPSYEYCSCVHMYVHNNFIVYSMYGILSESVLLYFIHIN